MCDVKQNWQYFYSDLLIMTVKLSLVLRTVLVTLPFQ